MIKIDVLCPFTHSSCRVCGLYRGRHYYMNFCKQHRGFESKSKKNNKSNVRNHSIDFEAIRQLVEPWAGVSKREETELKIRLKVLDVDDRTIRVCELDEAKAWDWSTLDIVRIIEGVQISRWDQLAEIVSYKAEKGYREIEIYEAPLFILLGGG